MPTPDSMRVFRNLRAAGNVAASVQRLNRCNLETESIAQGVSKIWMSVFDRMAQRINKIDLMSNFDQRCDDVSGVAPHALFITEIEGKRQHRDRRFGALDDGYRFCAAFLAPLDDEALDAVDPYQGRLVCGRDVLAIPAVQRREADRRLHRGRCLGFGDETIPRVQPIA